MKEKKKKPLEREALEELQELEDLAADLPQHHGDLQYELMIAEIVDQLQDVCPKVKQAAALRKLVAQFGDAYFFYNETGDFCLLTDFLHEAQEAEDQF